jgi:hypothetical protein
MSVHPLDVQAMRERIVCLEHERDKALKDNARLRALLRGADAEFEEIITTLTRERDAARAETARHVEVMIKMGLWRKSPCVVCEYDGPEYFQSDGPHYCARVAAALEAR